jgi:hypothetical protein
MIGEGISIMLKRLGLVVLVVALVAVIAPVQAAFTNTIDLKSVALSGCTAGSVHAFWGGAHFAAGTPVIVTQELLAGDERMYYFNGPQPIPFDIDEDWMLLYMGFMSKTVPDGTIMTAYARLADPGGAWETSDTIMYYCDTGEIFSAPAPGPDMVALPAQAVVGQFVKSTPIYFAPSADAAHPSMVMEAGKTLWVLGVDASGGFFKVLLSGQPFWVPVDSMGPNYDDVWNGTPLPGTVVE